MTDHPDSDGTAGRVVAVALLTLVCWPIATMTVAFVHGNWWADPHPRGIAVVTDSIALMLFLVPIAAAALLYAQRRGPRDRG